MIGKSKTCSKGYSCGSACIELRDNCSDKLADASLQISDNYLKIAKLGAKASLVEGEATTEEIASVDSKFSKLAEYINSSKATNSELDGVIAVMHTMYTMPKADRTGVKSIEIDQAEALFESNRFDKYAEAYGASFDETGFNPLKAGGMKDYIDSNVKLAEISDELTNAVWDTLPEGFKTTFKNAGSPREGYWTGKFEEDGITPIKDTKGSTVRGKETLKRYMEQKGISPYTGKFVHLKDAEGEHLAPEEITGKRGDQLNNFAWISAAENKWHSNLTPEDWKLSAERNILSRKESYASDLGKKKEEASASKGKQNQIAGKLAELNELASPQERQKAMRAVAEGLKAKSYKLLEAEGMTKTFQTPYPTKLKGIANDYAAGKAVKIPYRREIPDKDSKLIIGQYEAKFGNQNPTSLLFQAMAFAPDQKEALKTGFEKLMKSRQLDLNESIELFLANGNDAEVVKSAMAKKSEEFGKNFASMLEELVPEFK